MSSPASRCQETTTGGRPRLLDLFCGAGGAAKGYQQAGFYVVGVDKEPQPRYAGDVFIQHDAIEFLDALADGLTINGWTSDDFAAIHASPPCQAYSDLQKRTGREYPQLIEPTRARLRHRGLPYVIENVEGAPLINPIKLCGTMWPDLRVIRHRLFESNIRMYVPKECPRRHPLVFTHDKRKAHYGKLDQDAAFVQVTGGGNCTIKNAREAMGIDWMTKAELNEAIPPRYAYWCGLFLKGAIAYAREMEVLAA